MLFVWIRVARVQSSKQVHLFSTDRESKVYWGIQSVLDPPVVHAIKYSY